MNFTLQFTHFKHMIMLTIMCLCFIESHAKTLALVIGNQAYDLNEMKLDTPKNDASLIFKKLRLNGVEAEYIFDVNQAEIENKIKAFENKIEPDKDRVLIYYSGHGVYQNGKNFLISTDFQSMENTASKAIAVEDLINRFNVKKALSQIYIIDACRTIIDNTDSPLMLKNMDIGHRPLAIMHATSINQLAEQGYSSISPFTQALLDEFDYLQLKTVSQIFNEVESKVSQLTNSTQIPNLYSFGNNFYTFTAPLKRDISVAPLPRDVRFFMRDIYQINTSIISDLGKNKVKQVINELAPNFQHEISISVMSDRSPYKDEDTGEVSTPPISLSQRLALARANTFKSIIVNDYNISSSSITTQGGHAIDIEGGETYQQFLSKFNQDILTFLNRCKKNPTVQCINISVIIEDSTESKSTQIR